MITNYEQVYVLLHICSCYSYSFYIEYICEDIIKITNLFIEYNQFYLKIRGYLFHLKREKFASSVGIFYTHSHTV